MDPQYQLKRFFFFQSRNGDSRPLFAGFLFIANIGGFFSMNFHLWGIGAGGGGRGRRREEEGGGRGGDSGVTKKG